MPCTNNQVRGKITIMARDRIMGHSIAYLNAWTTMSDISIHVLTPTYECHICEMGGMAVSVFAGLSATFLEQGD